jgi:hypothetical protein
MKKVKPTKSVWSPEDLQEYLAEAVSAYKMDRDWQEVLDMLTRGCETNGSGQPETPHLTTSLEVTRGIQIVREYLTTIPRRSPTGGTEGKTIIPFKPILRQVSDIPKTPLIQAGVVSPGAQGSVTFPQTTEVEEAKQAAGDPIEDEVAIVRARATAMELVDAAAANARVNATAAQATEAMENVQVQLTQVQKQTSPEVPLESLAKEVQPEVQPEPTANEDIPAATVGMVALIATLQTMQHGMQRAMQHDRQHMQQDMQQTVQNAVSALETNVQTQLTDQQRSAQAWLQSMEEGVTQEQRTVFAKVDAKITSVSTGLEELANNAYESRLVVQDLKKKMEEQEQRVGTMNTAISTMILTRDAKSATVTSLPAAAGPPAKSLPTVPEPAARKDGPRSSAA